MSEKRNKGVIFFNKFIQGETIFQLFLLRHGLSALSETIAEFPLDDGHVPHSASAGSLPPASLDGPVVLPDFSGRVATWSTDFLLDVESDLSASTAQSMRLVAALSKGAGSLGHGETSPKISLVEVNQAIIEQIQIFHVRRHLQICPFHRSTILGMIP